MNRLFISYARADDQPPFVERLYQSLRDEGFEVWWDRASMPSRSLTFAQEIRDAIKAAERTIVVIGPAAVGSEYVQAEWQYALSLSRVVVPILRVGTHEMLPPELTRLHCPSFVSDERWRESLRELVRILREPEPRLGETYFVPQLPARFQPRPAELSRLYEVLLPRPPLAVPAWERIAALHGMGGCGKSVIATAFAAATETRRLFPDGILWLNMRELPTSGAIAERAASVLGGPAIRDADGGASPALRLRRLLSGKSCLLVADNVEALDQVTPVTDALDQDTRLLITSREGGLVPGALELPVGELSAEAALRHLADWKRQDPADLPPEAREVAIECGNLPFALALCGALAADGLSWADLAARLRAADLQSLKKAFPNYPYPNLLKAIDVSMVSLENSQPAAAAVFRKLAVFPPGAAAPEATVAMLWAQTDGLQPIDSRSALMTLERKALVRIEGEEPKRRISLHDLQHDYLRTLTADLKPLHEALLTAYQKERADGWSCGTDDGYYAANLAYHLREARGREELHKLLTGSPEWMRWKHRIVGGNLSFLADVELALAGFEDPTLPQDLTALTRIAAAQQVALKAASYPDSILIALARWGRIEEALRHARLRAQVKDKISGLLTIEKALRELGSPRPELLRESAAAVSREAAPEVAELFFAYLVEERLVTEALEQLGEFERRKLRPPLDPIRTLCALLVNTRREDEAQRVASVFGSDDESRLVRVLVLTREDRLSEAASVAKAIGDSKARLPVMMRLIPSTAEAGRLSEARRLLELVTDQFALDHLGAVVAKARRRNHWKNRLSRFVARLAGHRPMEPTSPSLPPSIIGDEASADPEQRARALIVKVAMAPPGDRGAVKAAIQAALEAIRQIPDEGNRTHWLTHFADQLRRISADSALAIAREARDAAMALGDAEQKTRQLCDLAAIVSDPKLGATAEADECLLLATAAVDRLKYQQNRDGALAMIAIALAKQKRMQEAIDLISAIGEEFERNRALDGVAQIATKLELPDAAKAALDRIPDTYAHEAHLTRIEMLAAKGCFDEARSAIAGLSRDSERLYALRRLSESFADAGRISEALATVEEIGVAELGRNPLFGPPMSDVREFHRSLALSHLSQRTAHDAELSRELIKQALAGARALGDAALRAKALTRSAAVLRAGGAAEAQSLFESALESAMKAEPQPLVDFSSPQPARAKAVLAVLIAMAQAGLHEEAAEAARSLVIEKADETLEITALRAYGLAAIAQVLPRACPPQIDLPRQLCQEAFTIAARLENEALLGRPWSGHARLVIAGSYASQRRFKDAFFVLSTATADLDVFLGQIGAWSEKLESFAPGSFCAALAESAAIVGWVRLDWLEFASKLRGRSQTGSPQ